MARHHLTLAAVLGAAVVLLAGAGCSVPPPATPADAISPGALAPPTATATAPAATAPAATAPAAPPPPTVAPTGAADPAAPDPAPDPGPAPTGTGGASGVLTAVPDVPRLLPLPADFTSPESVAAAYLQAWCYTPAAEPANTNITDSAPWTTAAGWADDTSRAVDDPTWADTRAAGVSTVCGPATADISTQAPNTKDQVWVRVSAQQARVRSDPATGQGAALEPGTAAGQGVLIGQGRVSMVRRVLRAADGRWLVDVRVLAG